MVPGQTQAMLACLTLEIHAVIMHSLASFYIVCDNIPKQPHILYFTICPFTVGIESSMTYNPILFCFQSDTNMVAYVAQPQTQATPGFAGQPTYVPPQYTYQPTPLYTGPGTQAPVVTQPAGAPVIVSQPTSRTTGTPGTAVNAQPGGAAAAEGL